MGKAGENVMGNDDDNDLISVIVPVYNVEKYLCRCVDSIIAQTYKNLEIILVDDGSPDKCGSMCDEYAAADSRIRVIHKKNGGLSDARNAGAAAARGEYIGFVDSDDYISNDMYERLHDAAEAADADVAICNFRYVDENGSDIKERNKSFPLNDEIISGRTALERTLDDMGWYYVTAWNRLYRRKILDAVYFPEGKLHEDEFVAHMVYGSASSVVCIRDVCYMYVQRSGSIMQSGYSLRSLDSAEALEQRFDYCMQHGMKDYSFRLSQRIYGILLEADVRLDRSAGRETRYSELKKIYLQQCRQVRELFTKRQWAVDVIIFQRLPVINRIAYRAAGGAAD